MATPFLSPSKARPQTHRIPFWQGWDRFGRKAAVIAPFRLSAAFARATLIRHWSTSPDESIPFAGCQLPYGCGTCGEAGRELLPPELHGASAVPTDASPKSAP